MINKIIDNLKKIIIKEDNLPNIDSRFTSRHHKILIKIILKSLISRLKKLWFVIQEIVFIKTLNKDTLIRTGQHDILHI